MLQPRRISVRSMIRRAIMKGRDQNGLQTSNINEHSYEQKWANEGAAMRGREGDGCDEIPFIEISTEDLVARISRALNISALEVWRRIVEPFLVEIFMKNGRCLFVVDQDGPLPPRMFKGCRAKVKFSRLVKMLEERIEAELRRMGRCRSKEICEDLATGILKYAFKPAVEKVGYYSVGCAIVDGADSIKVVFFKDPLADLVLNCW